MLEIMLLHSVDMDVMEPKGNIVKERHITEIYSETISWNSF